MITWMVRGFKLYNRVQDGWSKVKTLFIIQLLTVIYLLVHEFTTKSVGGYFLLVVLVSYGMFLTYSVVIDSMLEPNDDEKTDGIHLVNKVYRIFMHISTALLALSAYLIDGCRLQIFPPEFFFVALYSFVNAGFTHYLHKVYTDRPKEFLFDPDKLPPKTINNLRYNKELFDQQMNTLWKLTLFFSALSIAMIGIGVVISVDSAEAAAKIAEVNEGDSPLMRMDFVCIK